MVRRLLMVAGKHRQGEQGWASSMSFKENVPMDLHVPTRPASGSNKVGGRTSSFSASSRVLLVCSVAHSFLFQERFFSVCKAVWPSGPFLVRTPSSLRPLRNVCVPSLNRPFLTIGGLGGGERT